MPALPHLNLELRTNQQTPVHLSCIFLHFFAPLPLATPLPPKTSALFCKNTGGGGVLHPCLLSPLDSAITYCDDLTPLESALTQTTRGVGIPATSQVLRLYLRFLSAAFFPCRSCLSRAARRGAKSLLLHRTPVTEHGAQSSFFRLSNAGGSTQPKDAFFHGSRGTDHGSPASTVRSFPDSLPSIQAPEVRPGEEPLLARNTGHGTRITWSSLPHCFPTSGNHGSPSPSHLLYPEAPHRR